MVQEFGRRGYRLPEDGKVAKRMREALQLYEKNPEKGMPLEYRVVPETPITPGAVVTEVQDDDPEPTAGDQNPEVRRLTFWEPYRSDRPPRPKQGLD